MQTNISRFPFILHCLDFIWQCIYNSCSGYSTVFGSVALYSCDRGYELMGDANRTCGENEL